MIAKIAVLLAVFGLASAGVIGGGDVVAVGGGHAGVPAGAGVGPVDDVPPPKSVTYNVPSVSKVAYPGQAVTRSVETYSAPSIEKTTTITRSITAPINAPAERQIQYSAPAAPVLRAAAPAVLAAPIGFGAGGFGYAGGALGLGAYGGQGLGLATTYAAPALGYSIGGPAFGYAAAAPSYAFAAAPVAAYAAAPVAQYGAPAAQYGAPVAAKGGY